jgi:PAS domain S-box-containing protein
MGSPRRAGPEPDVRAACAPRLRGNVKSKDRRIAMNQTASPGPLPALARDPTRFRMLAIFAGGQVLIFGLLILVGLIVADNFRSTTRFQNEANASFERRSQMQRLLSIMQDAETGERGYIIAGKPEFLEPYADALSARAGQVEHLKTLLSGDAENMAAMARLSGLIDVEAAPLRQTIGAVQIGQAGQAAAIVTSGEGKRDMDAVRVVVAELLGREARRLGNGLNAELGSSARSQTLAYSLLLIIAALSVFISAAAFKFRDRRQALRQAKARLDERMAEIKQLERAEGRYRELLEAAPDAMVVVNQSGAIVLLNVQAEKQFGYHRDDLLGRKVEDIIPEGFAERLVADGTRTAAEAEAQWIGGGFELTGRRKDGSEFPIELMLSPLESAEGILVTAAIRDISVRKAAERHLAEIEGRQRRAEGALRESEDNYRALFQGVVDYGIVLLGPTGVILSWNTGAERMTGFKSEEMVGHAFSRFMLADDIERGRPEEILRLAASGGLLEIQGMRKRKDDTRFLVRATYTALRNPAGDLRGFSLISRDLSETTESGTKYRALLEAAPDAMVVVNSGGEIVLLNVQAEKQFGYRRDELVGQRVKNIIPEGFAERLIADDLRSAADALAQQIGAGIELTGRRKDGSEFPMELMLSPLESVEGILVTAAIRDISVRKAAERHLAQVEGRHRLADQALRESEERYRMLLDGVQDYAIFMMDPHGNIVSWNAGAERIKGYSAQQIIGHNFSCFFPPEDIDRGRPQDIIRVTAASGRHEEQGIRVRKDGSRFLAAITLTALRDPAGNLRGFSEFSHDLSESKESGAKYRGLLEAAPDAMVVVNSGGEIVLLNVQAEKQFGYRRDELVGQKVKNIIPEGFAERLIADDLRSAADALAQQIGTGIELTGRRKDGSEFPMELMLSPLESVEGILVTAAIRDISVRREAEKHLAQMEGRYRGLLEAAPDAMVVVNPGGEIVLLNVQAEKQFGYRRDELVGQKVKNIIPEGFAERLIADDLRSAADALAQQIGTGIELTGRRKDGSEFPIEIMLSPLESVEGILVTAAIRDISVRRDAERHLAQMEGRYRGLLEAAPDAMVVVNPGGEIVLLNVQAEKRFGYHRDELVGQKVKNIIPEGFAERLIADGLRSAADASAQQIGGGIELTGRRKDGSEFPIEIMLSPLDSAEGILVTAAIRDITARKKAEAHLRHISEIERMQSEFVSTVSHELRTPLTSIGGSLALIAGGAAGVINHRAGRLIEIANNNTQRLIRLVNDILDIEKLQSGRMVFQFAPVRIDEVIEQAISENLAYAASFGIELRRVGVGYDAVIKADAGRLNQAVTNLISNAVKFSATGACVEISAMRTELGVRISVADQGPGIPEDFRGRIFERFAQADSSDMRQKAGSGLGLNIVREIVQRHGGSVSFDSVIDRGASFHLDFPLAGGPQHETLPATEELQAGRAIVCALNAAVADPICVILRAHGFECAAVFTDERAAFEGAIGAANPATIDLPFARDDLGGIIRAFRDRRGADHFPVVLLCVEPAILESAAPKAIRFAGPVRIEHASEGAGNLAQARQRERLAILHIEDDHDLLEVVRQALQDEFTVVSAPTLDRARQHLVADKFDLVILDLTLSDGLGNDLIPLLVDAAGRPIPIVVFTAGDSTGELAGQVETILTKSRDTLALLVETVRSAIAATGRRIRENEEAPNEAA